MRRLVVLLVIAFGLAAAVGVAVYHLRSRRSPAEWLARRLGLQGAEMTAFLRIHEEYTAQCSDTCRRIAAADRALAESILSSHEVTPALRAAIEDAARIDAECRANMLRHFYAAAALVPESRRHEYLRLVLPLVLRGPMDMEFTRP